MKKLLLIILLTTSCSVMPRTVHKKKGIDTELKPYVADYRNIIGKDVLSHRFKRLSVNFSDIEGNILGRCFWLIGGGYEIEIDRNWWNLSSTTQIDKKFVMYHELEHCIRLRMHTDRKTEINTVLDFIDELGYLLGIIDKPGFLPDGCAVSLMNSYSQSTWCQEKHYEHYIKEMVDY